MLPARSLCGLVRVMLGEDAFYCENVTRRRKDLVDVEPARCGEGPCASTNQSGGMQDEIQRSHTKEHSLIGLKMISPFECIIIAHNNVFLFYFEGLLWI